MLQYTNPPIDLEFAQWIGHQNLYIPNLSAQNPEHVEKVHAALHKSLDAIFWYLEKHVLPQVNYSTEQLVVTPQHFLHAFKMSTVYSAVLGPTEAYGFYPPEALKEKLLKLKAAFASHVVHELSSDKNKKMLKLNNSDTPRDFFKQLWTLDPHLLTDLGMVIDVGGTLRDFTSEQIGAAFFEFKKSTQMK